MKIVFGSSRGAATECSPGREPWVKEFTKGERFFRPYGAFFTGDTQTHGLRRGLHSFAATRLIEA